jgi:hypothetical protein
MPKKYLVTLSDEDSALMEKESASRGRKPTNFAEYLIRVQLGSLKEATPIRQVKPQTAVKPENKQTPVTTASQPENEEDSAIEANKTERLETARQALQDTAPKPPVPTEEPDPNDWKPNRNAAAYRTRAANSIFTDGISFRLNKFGNTSYHRTLEEAIKHRDE